MTVALAASQTEAQCYLSVKSEQSHAKQQNLHFHFYKHLLVETERRRRKEMGGKGLKWLNICSYHIIRSS